MRQKHRGVRLGLVLVAGMSVIAVAQAQDWGKALKSAVQGSSESQTSSAATSTGSGLSSALGGLSLPSVSGDTAGNAAGVLQYCVKRKYLSADSVSSVKDKLLSKYGLGTEQQASESSDYQSGAAGLLKGDGGKSFNLDSVSGKVKDKACSYVLDNATKLL